MQPHFLFFVPKPEAESGVEALVVSAQMLNESAELPQPDSELLGFLVQQHAARTGHAIVGVSEVEHAIVSAGRSWEHEGVDLFEVTSRLDHLNRTTKLEIMRLIDLPGQIFNLFGRRPDLTSDHDRERNRDVIHRVLADATDNQGLGKGNPRSQMSYAKFVIRQSGVAIALLEANLQFIEGRPGKGKFQMHTDDGRAIARKVDVPLPILLEVGVDLHKIGNEFLRTQLEIVASEPNAHEWFGEHREEVAEALMGLSIEAMLDQSNAPEL